MHVFFQIFSCWYTEAFPTKQPSNVHGGKCSLGSKPLPSYISHNIHLTVQICAALVFSVTLEILTGLSHLPETWVYSSWEFSEYFLCTSASFYLVPCCTSHSRPGMFSMTLHPLYFPQDFYKTFIKINFDRKRLKKKNWYFPKFWIKIPALHENTLQKCCGQPLHYFWVNWRWDKPGAGKASQHELSEKLGNWCGKSARSHPGTREESANGWAWNDIDDLVREWDGCYYYYY